MPDQFTTIVLAAISLMILGGCNPSNESPETATTHSAAEDEAIAQSIAWFDGSVDEAFAYAKTEGKPIYLYWGAEWCPPCHAIKATVFKSAEFITRSQLFVPVYLDGDTENAQQQGEKFAVLGYPTMIVFDAHGTELTRIPGGIDIQAYANILDIALSRSTPIDGLVDEIIAGDKNLSEIECRLVTYYSWGQNPELMQHYDVTRLYRAMFDACPSSMRTERSILYMSYLDELIDSIDAEVPESALTEAQITEARGMVGAMLDDPELIYANMFAIIFNGAGMTRALTKAGTSERGEMAQGFNAALNQLADNETVYKRDRVYTALGKIYMERIDDPEADLSDELKNEIRAIAKWADETTPDPYERQDIINSVSNVLDRAGMNEVAKPLLLAELEKSTQPYYFMLGLANIEQTAGNVDEAVLWLEKAYDTSRGPATRFQWGYYYISGLIEMTPNDAEQIRNATVKVIRELEDGVGIYQRPKAQLRRLENSLIQWGKETEQGAAVEQIRGDVLAMCDNFSGEPGSFEICQAFLDPA